MSGSKARHIGRHGLFNTTEVYITCSQPLVAGDQKNNIKHNMTTHKVLKLRVCSKLKVSLSTTQICGGNETIQPNGGEGLKSAKKVSRIMVL